MNTGWWKRSLGKRIIGENAGAEIEVTFERVAILFETAIGTIFMASGQTAGAVLGWGEALGSAEES
ncbi:MAG TPA: hypothetical protein VGN88_07395, partial [Phycisphaerae bacterium]